MKLSSLLSFHVPLSNSSGSSVAERRLTLLFKVKVQKSQCFHVAFRRQRASAERGGTALS